MPKSCEICGEIAKYKCPTCQLPYCSVNCCKRHKEKCCSKSSKNEELKAENEEVQSVNAEINNMLDSVIVNRDKLLKLGNDGEMKKMLSNKHLQDLLQTIDQSQDPEKIMQKAMQEPLFVEFADACLKVVDINDSN